MGAMKASKRLWPMKERSQEHDKKEADYRYRKEKLFLDPLRVWGWT